MSKKIWSFIEKNKYMIFLIIISILAIIAAVAFAAIKSKKK